MNYEDLSLLELREIAKEREIKNVSKLKYLMNQKMKKKK